MSNSQRWSVCIEGIPRVLGNDLPSWHDGTLDAGLVEMPHVEQSIDAMGGVATFASLDLDVVDLSGHWAQVFRVRQPGELRAISPNPIEWDEDEITLEDASTVAAGDILYAEQDTWSVDSVAGEVLTVTRQAYSCLEGGWRCRYQAGVSRDYVTACSKSGPVTVMGRLVAVYIDGDLEMLGRIVDLRQLGRSWKIRIDDILSVLTRPIKPTGLGVRLRYPWNWNAAAWQAGTFAQTVDAATGDHGGTIEDLSSAWDPGWNTIDPAPDDAWIFEPSCGMRWYGGDTGTDNPQEIRESSTYHGTVQALGSEWYFKNLVGHCTRPNGCRPYGCILTRTLTGNDYLEVSETYYDGLNYAIRQYQGALIMVGDQLCRVESVNQTHGRIYIDAIISRETGELYANQSAGLDSPVWIELPVAPVISSDSLYTAIQNVLNGTGAYGLGLPPDVISDAPAQPVGGISPVWWDWEAAGIDGDLRARGLCVILRDGKVEVRQVSPPIPQAATSAILQADLTLSGGVPEIARGYEAPIASISYAVASRELTFSWSADTPITSSSLRDLKLESATRDTVPDELAWFRLQAARLRWLSVGIPTIRFGLPRDTLQLGDIITLTSRYIASGDYKSETLAGIVIGRTPGRAEYMAAMNLGPVDEGAIWALGIEVESAADAAITPTNIADLSAFAALVPVGSDVIITEHDQTSVLWEGTITSYQAATVTLSSAPIIGAADIAILTCASIPGTTYGDLVERQVYAADASGEIDGTYPAKVLI